FCRVGRLKERRGQVQRTIPLLKRNNDGDRLVRDEVVPGAEWVLAGEGVATRKWDGTCCLIRDGKLYKRYEAKVRFATADDPEQGCIGVRDGKSEGFLYVGFPPYGFELACEPDPRTGKVQGWVPVSNDKPEDRWHREGWALATRPTPFAENVLPDGTYELCGPKAQNNAERLDAHRLIPHGIHYLPDAPRTYHELKAWLATQDIEGIV